MKKFFLALGILILGILLIFGFYDWFLQKQKRVLNGTASPVFPYSDYSHSDLDKLYPHDAQNFATTVQSPEETHQKFLSALKKEDFDEAVFCCFREGDRVKMKDFLVGLKNKGQLNLMISDIKEIHKDIMGNMTATYLYSGTYQGEKITNFITFIKTSNGYWYIESL